MKNPNREFFDDLMGVIEKYRPTLRDKNGIPITEDVIKADKYWEAHKGQGFGFIMWIEKEDGTGRHMESIMVDQDKEIFNILVARCKRLADLMMKAGATMDEVIKIVTGALKTAGVDIVGGRMPMDDERWMPQSIEELEEFAESECPVHGFDCLERGRASKELKEIKAGKKSFSPYTRVDKKIEPC
jgi:predicted CopG family antitoxin